MNDTMLDGFDRLTKQIDDDQRRMANRIRQFTKIQAEFWQQVPFWSIMQRCLRKSYYSNTARDCLYAYGWGVWPVESEVVWHRPELFVACNSGTLITVGFSDEQDGSITWHEASDELIVQTYASRPNSFNAMLLRDTHLSYPPLEAHTEQQQREVRMTANTYGIELKHTRDPRPINWNDWR